MVREDGPRAVDRYVPDAEREKRIAAALRRLAEFFPYQCEEKTKTLYYEKLVRSRRHPEDVERAIERVIDTREQKSFPPWAAIADRLTDITKECHTTQHDWSNEPQLDTSPEGIEAMLTVFRTARAMDMPARKKKQPGPRAQRRPMPPLTRPARLPPLTARDIALIKELNGE